MLRKTLIILPIAFLALVTALGLNVRAQSAVPPHERPIWLSNILMCEINRATQRQACFTGTSNTGPQTYSDCIIRGMQFRMFLGSKQFLEQAVTPATITVFHVCENVEDKTVDEASTWEEIIEIHDKS
jgi:hypothetical protein